MSRWAARSTPCSRARAPRARPTRVAHREDLREHVEVLADRVPAHRQMSRDPPQTLAQPVKPDHFLQSVHVDPPGAHPVLLGGGKPRRMAETAARTRTGDPASGGSAWPNQSGPDTPSCDSLLPPDDDERLPARADGCSVIAAHSADHAVRSSACSKSRVEPFQNVEFCGL